MLADIVSTLKLPSMQSVIPAETSNLMPLGAFSFYVETERTKQLQTLVNRQSSHAERDSERCQVQFLR